MSLKREFYLLGQKIVVKTQEEADLAEKAIKIAQHRINSIQDQSPLLGPQQISVLALLELAGDLIKERKKMDEYRAELDQRCTSILQEFKNQGSQAV